MRYLLSSRWALTERFTITDQSGNPAYEVKGNFGLVQRISLQGADGQELAVLQKHIMANRYEIIMGGQTVAEVFHKGLFGQHYEIDSSFGGIDAQGDFAGWQYGLSRGGAQIAQVSRQLALKEQFEVDIADNENAVFVLAVILAIDNIHDERRDQGRTHGLGGGFAGTGIL